MLNKINTVCTAVFVFVLGRRILIAHKMENERATAYCLVKTKSTNIQQWAQKTNHNNCSFMEGKLTSWTVAINSNR